MKTRAVTLPKKVLRRRSKRPISAFNTDEMEEHSDGYVEFVLEQLEKAKQTCPDPLVLIEQKVDLSDFVPGRMERQTVLWFQTIPCTLLMRSTDSESLWMRNEIRSSCVTASQPLVSMKACMTSKKFPSQYSSQDVRMFKHGRYPWRS